MPDTERVEITIPPTYRDSGDYTWQDGNGAQPDPPHASAPTGYAYTIRGERITANPAPRSNGAGYDVRTLPARIDADLDAIRRDMETLRACMAEMVDALEEVGLRLPDGARAVRWERALEAMPYPVKSDNLSDLA